MILRNVLISHNIQTVLTSTPKTMISVLLRCDLFSSVDYTPKFYYLASVTKPCEHPGLDRPALQVL